MSPLWTTIRKLAAGEAALQILPCRATPQKAEANMKEIPLSRGLIALVDNADFESLSRWKWHAVRSQKTFYAVRSVQRGYALRKLKLGRRPTVYMHVELFGGPCDHKNRNGLDNQRSNLRAASRSEQGANRGIMRNNRCGFKGVALHGGKWQASIGAPGKVHYLGRYLTAEDAARAYDAAARKYFGEFAVPNFT